MKKIVPNGIPAFHGELSLRSIDKLPEGVVATEEARRSDGKHIVGHSETGHHHVATGGTYYRDPNNEFLAYLVTKGPVQIQHEKPGPDQHETYELLAEEGEVIWEIGTGRELREGVWRKSID